MWVTDENTAQELCSRAEKMGKPDALKTTWLGFIVEHLPDGQVVKSKRVEVEIVETLHVQEFLALQSAYVQSRVSAFNVAEFGTKA